MDTGGGMFGAVVVLFIVGVAGFILWGIAKGIAQWSYNNAQPVLTRPATLVTKRTSTSGGMNDTSVSTFYHATWEFEDGTRQEFTVSGTQYGLLVEGDRGTLTSQGTRFKGFARGA